MSKIKVNSIEAATGSTITIPSGQTLDISSTTLTLPSTVVTTTGTQTLTNKTIGVSQLTGTLPVANGGTGLTALGTASQVLRVNSGATALEFGTVGTTAGQVIQVVSTTKQDTFSQSSTTTFADITGLSVSITPASASNKILVIISLQTGNSSDSYRNAFRLMRDSTAIGGGTSEGSRQSAFGQVHITGVHAQYSVGFNYLDSPSTTSSTTYKVQMITEQSGVTGYINRNSSNSDNNEAYSVRTSSTITVMEIKG